MEDYEEQKLKLIEEGHACQSKLNSLKEQIAGEQEQNSEEGDIGPNTTWNEVWYALQ